MHVFRLFGIFVLVPLISVGLCAQDSSENGRKPHREDNTRHLSQSNSTTSPVTFPENLSENATKTGPHSISPRRHSDSLPNHPHPLHLHVQISNPVSNSTRIISDALDQGQGRGFVLELFNLTWIASLLWKAISSYAIVFLVNLLILPFAKKLGYGGPYWETSINLGNEGENHLFNFGPSLKKFRLSFGDKGSSKDDMKEDESSPGNGWGWGPPPPKPSYGHGQPGHAGFNPHHVGPGWLSYDQAALALPMVDKYSMKAAKKAQKYTKKAQKYAHKASKYAAKAQAAKLSMKPLYANGFIHPGAATVPGIPSYGWGK